MSEFFYVLKNSFALLGFILISIMVLTVLLAKPQNQASQETKTEIHNPKFITPQPNEPIEIGTVGNRTFFLAKIDDKECISVIGLNMGSYVICGNEQPQTTQ